MPHQKSPPFLTSSSGLRPRNRAITVGIQSKGKNQLKIPIIQIIIPITKIETAAVLSFLLNKRISCKIQNIKETIPITATAKTHIPNPSKKLSPSILFSQFIIKFCY